ncbi:MAG: histidine phosphatase family protein [Anaerolineae bacterium]
MPTTKILLIRHGETDANRGRVFQGQTGLGLNARGKAQAQLLADRLATANMKLDALYSSDLQRAWETAEFVGTRLDVCPIPEPGLREVFLGAWQGLSYDEVAQQFPDEWTAWRRGEDLRRGGGENYVDLQTRMMTTLDRLVRAHSGATLGVVSHGAAIKLFVAGVLGIEMARLPYFHVASNTAVTVVAREPDGDWDLLIWNDARHLPNDPLAEAFLEDA